MKNLTYVSLCLCLLLPIFFGSLQVTETVSDKYSFTTEEIWLTMKDGVRLSATLNLPIPKISGEKFPVLLEYKPYRKDDSFYNYNQPNTHYLVRRGFIVATVDIRGTGSSAGHLIEYEYTSLELDDCECVIEQLSNHPRSNGRVGMYGLSWSAFNSLMMATFRRPPALRAIFAAHGSEDLYKNDIHYLDGILHQDGYILYVDHENALPAAPDYILNEQWLKERFTKRPWIDVYLEQQLDGPFWRAHSIKYNYGNLTVPVYLLGGLYDGYRDFAMNIYENARQVSPKIKVVIGPFVHAMPEDAYRNPGPGFDGKAEMVRWFNHWLRDDAENTDLLNEPDLTLFIRTNFTAGAYRYESEWPICGGENRRMFMCKGHRLVEQIKENLVDCTDVDILQYRPWIGFEAGGWWGYSDSDQRSFDEDCLVYDSDPINETIEIAGFVQVSLQISSTAPLAHWVAHLEDVDINGHVWLVTGGAINGAQRETLPTSLEFNHIYTLKLQLRFTTWTFFPGHRIRIAISNAMFPAFWPSPYSMNISLYLNATATFIELPVIPTSSSQSPPAFTQQQMPTDEIPSYLFSGGQPSVNEKHDTDSTRTLITKRTSHELLPNGCFFSTLLVQNFTCSRLDPADVQWTTYARNVYVFGMNGYSSIEEVAMKDEDETLYPDVDLSTRRHFELRTDLTCYSDHEFLYVDLKRQLFHWNGTAYEPPISFVFNEKHKRQFQ